MLRCIVSTGDAGRVWVTYPTPEFMRIFTNGGAPASYFGEWTRDGQIASMVKRGIREDVAVRWIGAMLCGGLTTAEAYGLIRDRCTDPTWTASELWDRSDLPADRYFRDAWSRSPNGGPISIRLPIAKSVQFKNIRDAVDIENRKRTEDFERDRPLLDVDLMAIRARIKAAQCEKEIRSIWFC